MGKGKSCETVHCCTCCSRAAVVSCAVLSCSWSSLTCCLLASCCAACRSSCNCIVCRHQLLPQQHVSLLHRLWLMHACRRTGSVLVPGVCRYSHGRHEGHTRHCALPVNDLNLNVAKRTIQLLTALYTAPRSCDTLNQDFKMPSVLASSIVNRLIRLKEAAAECYCDSARECNP